MRHSGFGIASFLIAVGAGLLEFALVAAAAVLEASTPGGIDEDSPVAILLGLGIFGGLCIALVGIGLGVAGLCQQNRSKVFAVLGVVFGSAVLLGVLLLLVIGSLMP
jgi:hypothetical protein